MTTSLLSVWKDAKKKYNDALEKKIPTPAVTLTGSITNPIKINKSNLTPPLKKLDKQFAKKPTTIAQIKKFEIKTDKAIDEWEANSKKYRKYLRDFKNKLIKEWNETYDKKQEKDVQFKIDAVISLREDISTISQMIKDKMDDALHYIAVTRESLGNEEIIDITLKNAIHEDNDILEYCSKKVYGLKKAPIRIGFSVKRFSIQNRYSKFAHEMQEEIRLNVYSAINNLKKDLKKAVEMAEANNTPSKELNKILGETVDRHKLEINKSITYILNSFLNKNKDAKDFVNSLKKEYAISALKGIYVTSKVAATGGLAFISAALYVTSLFNKWSDSNQKINALESSLENGLTRLAVDYKKLQDTAKTKNNKLSIEELEHIDLIKSLSKQYAYRINKEESKLIDPIGPQIESLLQARKALTNEEEKTLEKLLNAHHELKVIHNTRVELLNNIREAIAGNEKIIKTLPGSMKNKILKIIMSNSSTIFATLAYINKKLTNISRT